MAHGNLQQLVMQSFHDDDRIGRVKLSRTVSKRERDDEDDDDSDENTENETYQESSLLFIAPPRGGIHEATADEDG